MTLSSTTPRIDGRPSFAVCAGASAVCCLPHTIINHVDCQTLSLLYWSFVSRRESRLVGRDCRKEVRNLIFRMVEENATWGAPRIHGELLMLGFEV